MAITLKRLPITTRPNTYPWLCASREVTYQFGEVFRQVWDIPIQEGLWIYKSDLKDTILKVTGDRYDVDYVINVAQQQWGWEIVRDTEGDPNRIAIPQLFHYLSVICGRIDKLHVLVYPFGLAMQEWEGVNE